MATFRIKEHNFMSGKGNFEVQRRLFGIWFNATTIDSMSSVFNTYEEAENSIKRKGDVVCKVKIRYKVTQ